MMRRYFIPLSFLFIAAFAGIMVLLLHTKDNTETINQHTPNLFMTQAKYYNYNKTGELTAIIQTPLSSYNTTSKHIDMSKPHITTYKHDNITWEITADHGFTQNSNTKIDLEGHVVFHQLSNNDEPDTIITTPQATLLPKDSLAKSQHPITIQHGESIIKGIGMTADLKNNNYQLIKQSIGSYSASNNHKVTN